MSKYCRSVEYITSTGATLMETQDEDHCAKLMLFLLELGLKHTGYAKLV